MAILPNFTLRLEPELRDLVKAAVRYARQAGGRERLEEFLAGGQGEGHQALAGQVADLAERLARLEETKTLERQGFMDMAARLEPLEALAAGIDGTILAMIRRELETSKADAMQSALHQKTPQDALQGHVTAGDANTPGQPETTIQDAPQGQGEAKKPDTQARKAELLAAIAGMVGGNAEKAEELNKAGWRTATGIEWNKANLEAWARRNKAG